MTPSRRQLCHTLFWSGLFGFWVGAFGHAAWQIAVEDAQVLAGVVQYPFKSPEYHARTALWALVNQVSAVFLWLGVSERVLSIALSGFLGCLSFQALSVLTLVLSRRVLLALACPFFVHYSRLLESVGDVVYPVFLSGLHTHGILGLSFMALTVGLLAVGGRRVGACLLGLAPAVHLSWAAWTWGLVGLAWLLFEEGKIKEIRRHRAAFLGGLLLAAVSFSIQRFAFRDVPWIPAETASSYLNAFTRLWDYHRRPLTWAEISSSRTFFLAVIGLGMGGWGLLKSKNLYPFSPLPPFPSPSRGEGISSPPPRRGRIQVGVNAYKNWMPPGGVFLLRIFLLANALGLAALFLHAVPLDRLPTVVALLMPGRWINLASFMTLPIFLSLIGNRRENAATQVVLAGFLIVVAIKAPFWVLKGMALFLLLFVASHLFSTLHPLRHGRIPPQPTPPKQLRLRRLEGGKGQDIPPPPGWGRVGVGVNARVASAGRWVQAVILLWMAGSVLLHAWKAWPESWRQLKDRGNDTFFASVARGQGMVVASQGANMIQLRTRRPLLFSESKLDLIAYVPSVGPELNRLLQGISGLDFLAPPARPDAQLDGLRSMNFGWLGRRVKETWESRDVSGWQAIRREFGTTDVVTAQDWRLQLPEVARNDEFVLYRIPE